MVELSANNSERHVSLLAGRSYWTDIGNVTAPGKNFVSSESPVVGILKCKQGPFENVEPKLTHGHEVSPPTRWIISS